MMKMIPEKNTEQNNITFDKKMLNKIYLPLLENRMRYEILYGGAGSGKSVFTAQRLLFRILGERGHRFLVVRKVARTNRHSTFSLISNLIREWKVQHLFKANKSGMEIICANHNSILFCGLDDVEKLKSISGITGIWIEEATEISEEDFNQLNLRLRGRTNYPKQITLTFNPVSALNWIKKRFFDSTIENSFILKTTYKDNKFIDDEYKKVLEELKEQDEIYYQVYAHGEWGLLGNLVYTNWEVTAKIPKDFEKVFWGLDFGYNNPTALIKVGVCDKQIYILEEFYKTGLTNLDLMSVLEKKVQKYEDIYADSAEPARIEEIRRKGLNVYPADKRVKDGIDAVKRNKLHISGECTNLLKEIQVYKYKKDKDDNVLDEPVKFQDHAMDALRYAIYTGTKQQGEWAAF